MARKPSTNSIIRNMKKQDRSFEPKAPIATEMFLPNVSNVQDFARKDRPASAFTAGSILFADTDGRIAQDNSKLFWDDTNKIMGIGTNTPDGLLNVFSGSAGVVSARTAGDDFVIENSTNAGMSILTPDTNTSTIIFGSPTDPLGADIKWNHDNDKFIIGSRNTGAALEFVSGAGVVALNIDGNQDFNFQAGNLTTTGTVQGVTQAEFDTLTDNSMADALHRHSELSASDGTPDRALVVDAAGNVGIGTASPGRTLDVTGKVSIDSTGKSDTEYIDFNSGGVTIGGIGRNVNDIVLHSPFGLRLNEGGTDVLNVAGGNVGIGTTTPTAKLHVDQSSTTAAKPPLILDQADLSEEMIDFKTTIGATNPVRTKGGLTLNTTHFIRVRLPDGLMRYIPVGDISL